MKRFTDNTKWYSNYWFRKLPPEYKLFWLYILDCCDQVGVWEIDYEHYEFVSGVHIDLNGIKEYFGDRLKFFDNKLWIQGFIQFQYGELVDSPHNKPHKAYLQLLKKHNLLKDYTKSTDSLSDRLQEKEKEKEKEKDKEIKGGVGVKIEVAEKVTLTQKEIETLKEKLGSRYEEAIEKLSAYKQAHNKKYKSDYGAINSWVIDEVSKPKDAWKFVPAWFKKMEIGTEFTGRLKPDSMPETFTKYSAYEFKDINGNIHLFEG